MAEPNKRYITVVYEREAGDILPDLFEETDYGQVVAFAAGNALDEKGESND